MLLFQLSDFYEGDKQVEFIRQSLSVTHNISEITCNGNYFKQILWVWSILYGFGIFSVPNMVLLCISMALQRLDTS